jgi:hypothetical protein
MAEDDADVPIPTSLIGERTLTELLFLLRRPFPPATFRSRKIDDRLVRYTPIGAVIDRLNRAAGAWNFTIVGATLETLPGTQHAQTAEERVCIVVGELTIPGLGARQAHGMAAWDVAEDPLTRAEADALRHAAGLFGVPLIEGTAKDPSSQQPPADRQPTRRPRRPRGQTLGGAAAAAG